MGIAGGRVKRRKEGKREREGKKRERWEKGREKRRLVSILRSWGKGYKSGERACNFTYIALCALFGRTLHPNRRQLPLSTVV